MISQKSIDSIRSFNRFYANLLSLFDRKFYQSELTLVEDNVMTEVANQSGITPSEIINNLHINKGQLSKILTKLIARGLLVKKTAVNDKRSYQLVMTDKGRSVHQRQVEAARNGLSQQVGKMTDGEVGRLLLSMQTIQRSYEQDHQVTVRLGTGADLGLIADLHSRTYATMGYTVSLQKYVMRSVADFIEQGDKGEFWIAAVDGVRVGTIGLVQTTDGWWQLRWFVTDPSYQGHGIGKRLLKTVMDYIHEHQLAKVFLWTIDELKTARNLYGREGFVPVETHANTEWKPEKIIEEKWVLESR